MKTREARAQADVSNENKTFAFVNFKRNTYTHAHARVRTHAHACRLKFTWRTNAVRNASFLGTVVVFTTYLPCSLMLLACQSVPA